MLSVEGGTATLVNGRVTVRLDAEEWHDFGARGTLALVGAAKPGSEVSFEYGSSLVKGWTFETVVQGSSVPQVFIPRLIELWRQGRFPFEKLIREYALEDINDGFEASRDGSVIKPVVVFPH